MFWARSGIRLLFLVEARTRRLDVEFSRNLFDVGGV